MTEEKTIGKKTLELSEEVSLVATDVIKKENINVLGARIGYMKVYPNISKTIAGKCIRASKELNFFSDYDYIIQVSGDLWDGLNDEVKHILMYHELKHIYIKTNEKTGETEYKIMKHDVEDFADIIKKYGVDWIGTIRTTLASIYDLDAEQIDTVTL